MFFSYLQLATVTGFWIRWPRLDRSSDSSIFHYGPFLYFYEAEWDRVIAGSLKGVFLGLGSHEHRSFVGRRAENLARGRFT